ncbi:hypothetical protein A7P61_03965 (plasmid) [Pantoea agglomerans pv. betae]|uniref:hypothetical protein n=1 Tax=Enterobacter agglomerans TaxID=549 RepID=UPI0007E5A3B7|nr:hypothetical protein [Pantoea agglomerans]WHU82353.1 hypothetical protein A7P61_03965 [Pantoea agglomerans pv. betae]
MKTTVARLHNRAVIYFQKIAMKDIDVQSAPLRRQILINVQRVRRFCVEEGLPDKATRMIQACLVQSEKHCLTAYERRVNR